MILSVTNQTLEKQVEFYVIKDITTVSDIFLIQNPTDSIFLFPKNETQSISDSLYKILINPLLCSEKTESGYRYEAKPKAQYIQNWSIIILVFLFVILASIRTTPEKYTIQLFQSIFNNSKANRLYRDKFNSLTHVSFRLDVLFILVVGLLLYQTVNYILQYTTETSLTIFGISIIAILVFVTLKFSLYKMSGFIFDANSEIQEYIFYAKTGNRIMGLILFPIVVSLFFIKGIYTEYFLIFSGIIILIVSIINILKGIKVIAQKVFSIYYMILYLCTLEILPLLIMWRILWRS